MDTVDRRVYNIEYKDLLGALIDRVRHREETVCEVDNSCNSISLVNDKIWATLNWKTSIQIIDDTNEPCFINFGDIQPSSVTHDQSKNNAIYIGSSKGLYTVSMKGKSIQKQKACEGNIDDISLCSNDRILAYDRTSHSVLIYQCRNHCWESKRLVELKEKTSKNSIHTLLYHNDTVYVGSSKDNKVLCFNLGGELINTISTVTGVSGSKSLNVPHICGVDSVGCLIICDHNNSRLLVYSPDPESPEWTQYKLSEKPGDIVIRNDRTVYVLYQRSLSSSVIKKYTAL